MILIVKFNYGTDETAIEQQDIEYECYEVTEESINNLIAVYKNTPWFETYFVIKNEDFDMLDQLTTEEMEDYLVKNVVTD
ncbi:hypothetical protein [Citrobacter phage Ci1]|nr:hypothetical protein [Citrobacter phage Ci1]